MNNNNSNSNSNNRDRKRPGLFIAGTVIDRTRRRVPASNPTTEIVTYTILASNQQRFYVDDYAPSSYLDLDKYVCIPVYIKPFIKKNGEASFNINVQKDFKNVRGEHF